MKNVVFISLGGTFIRLRADAGQTFYGAGTMLIKSFCRLLTVMTVVVITTWNVSAKEPNADYSKLVPQVLLGLLHAPEVHQDLKLSSEQVEELENLLRELDTQWFPSRILPVDEQRTANQRLESKVWEWFKKSASEKQQERLGQLEYWGQGSRMLLRKDLAERIGLQASQQQKLAALVRSADEAKRALGSVLHGDEQLKTLRAKAEQATRAERDSLMKIVRPEQQLKLKAVLGDPFDPTGLKRIYAMAPEFSPVDHWLNSEPLSMRALRGQVVLVHFYAFQCHNCHANFEIYRRWHKDLAKKGVVVVGIQTPETSRERDAEAVKQAASERDLRFPILIDLKSENWKAWGNTMWPSVYVVDKQGYIRFWWQGELNWKGATGDKTIEETVDRLLAEE